MSIIVDVVNAVNSFAYDVKHFFYVDIYVFFTKFFGHSMKWLAVAFYKIKNIALGFIVTFFEDFLFSMTLGQDLASAFNSLDSNMLSILNVLRVPEAVNIIMSSYFTRLLFRMLGI